MSILNLGYIGGVLILVKLFMNHKSYLAMDVGVFLFQTLQGFNAIFNACFDYNIYYDYHLINQALRDTMKLSIITYHPYKYVYICIRVSNMASS